ncbi:hypothetical protein R5R35_000562 [Gryllus longicercus]|uniref:Uncharacterized protein n=1 Tax=Gryllus longicercus TaxID=2509291 RepID=A0AAN9VX54_9ORTH
MAVANSTMTPLPVRWRFPQEAEEEDESLEQDSLGNGEFDSLQHPGGSPAPTPPAPAADDPTDAWAPQSILDAAPRDAHSFEMQQFAYATRDSRFDILKQAGHAFQQHCRGRADDRRYGGGGNNNNNNNNNSYVHPAIFDQDKWEKHKQLIRDYFESQQQLEETAQLTAEWNDIHNPPDWEPYRRPVLHAAAAAAAQGPADGAQLPQGGTWPEALPPIREQPGEVGDGDDEEEEEEEDDEDEEEEDEDEEEEEPDGRRLSPAGEARDARPGSRDSSASPASNRGKWSLSGAIKIYYK